MNSLYRDLLLTLFHSFWQAGILFLFFSIYAKHRKSSTPASLRFLSISLLFSQVVISVVSFFIIREDMMYPWLKNLFFVQAYSLIPQVHSKWILLCYISIFIFFQSRSYFIWKSFYVNISKGLITPNESFMTLAAKQQIKTGFLNDVAFYFHNNIPSPMTFGFWKPIIVFPVALVNQLSIEETESLILHELQHIKNHDFLFLRSIELINNIYFFNPFISLLKSKAEANMELSCDHVVLKKNGNMIAYAVALQKTASFSTADLSVASVNAVGNKGKVVSRLVRFPELMRKELRTTYSPWQLFPYMLIFFILSLFSQKQPISISSINNYSFAEKIVPNKLKNPPVIEGFKKSEQPSKPDDVLQKQISKEQSDIFQSMSNSSSSMTSYSTGNKSKQITIEEETAGTGIRTTSSFLILDENGIIQNTWLWSVEETIETTDSIYSDTLVQFHEYVEDLR